MGYPPYIISLYPPYVITVHYNTISPGAVGYHIIIIGYMVIGVCYIPSRAGGFPGNTPLVPSLCRPPVKTGYFWGIWDRPKNARFPSVRDGIHNTNTAHKAFICPIRAFYPPFAYPPALPCLELIYGHSRGHTPLKNLCRKSRPQYGTISGYGTSPRTPGAGYAKNADISMFFALFRVPRSRPRPGYPQKRQTPVKPSICPVGAFYPFYGQFLKKRF